MAFTPLYIRESKAITRAKGSLLVTEEIPYIKLGEIVEVEIANGEVKRGQAIDIGKNEVVIQVFGGVSEVDLKGSNVR